MSSRSIALSALVGTAEALVRLGALEASHESVVSHLLVAAPGGRRPIGGTNASHPLP